MTDITNDQILDWYNQHKGDANFSEAAGAAMSQYGVGQDRANAVIAGTMTQAAQSPVDPGAARKAAAKQAYLDWQVARYRGRPEASEYDDTATAERGILANADEEFEKLYAPVALSPEQEAYTKAHAMSREDFLKKYGTTFGANAASEVAGMNVADYYDDHIGANRLTHTWQGEGDGASLVPTSGNGNQVYGSKYWDAYDEVNPHPESQVVTGVQGFINHMKPLAAMAAMAYGANALVGGWATAGSTATYSAGAALDAGITAATTAPGVAGMVGMAPGVAATAVNAGALNTGVSLAMDRNIGDSLKSGATAAVLSGFGGWTSDGIKGATASLGPTASRALATVGSNVVTGATGAAINGTDIGKGALTGVATGVISEASRYVGGWAREATDSADVGKAASTVSSTILRGGDLSTAVTNAGANYVGDQVGETVGGGYAGDIANTYARSAVTGRRASKSSLLSSLQRTYSRRNRLNHDDNA